MSPSTTNMLGKFESEASYFRELQFHETNYTFLFTLGLGKRRIHREINVNMCDGGAVCTVLLFKGQVRGSKDLKQTTSYQWNYKILQTCNIWQKLYGQVRNPFGKRKIQISLRIVRGIPTKCGIGFNIRLHSGFQNIDISWISLYLLILLDIGIAFSSTLLFCFGFLIPF